MTRLSPLHVVGTGVLGLVLLIAACGSDDGGAAEEASAGAAEGTELDPADWDSVLAAADGGTVNWYMYGQDDDLNAYVGGYVTDAAAELGVTVNQVRVTDTVEAVNTVLGEQQAGVTDDGAVDLIWINGENFATGVQADLWYCGWPELIPSAEFVDFESPAVETDFGIPVDGCEAAWNAETSALVYDSEVLAESDVASVESFQSWVEANPGRFTYPAPPDFSGSMAVRTFLYDQAGGYENLLGDFDQTLFEETAGPLWERLNALEPSLWRGGETYPTAQTDVETLYANGEIDAYLSYGTGGLGVRAEDGVIPESTRTALFDGGMIGNVNFLAIPDNSPNKAEAMVLANLLQSPEAQYEKKVNPPGFGPGIDVTRAGEFAEQFAAIEVAPQEVSDADLAEATVPELQSEWLTSVEAGWIENVLQQ